MTDPDTLYIWVDIETTGLDHTEDHLLEVGAICTRADLVQVDSFHGITGPPAGWQGTDPESWPLDVVVADMHTVSGLLSDVAAQPPGAPDEDDLVDAFLAWAEGERVTSGAASMTIAGSGVAGFDVPWLRARADPYLQWPFSYRTLDLSPVRMLLGLAGIDIHLDASSGPAKAHRAMGDVQAHLAEARLLRGTLTRILMADELLADLLDVRAPGAATPEAAAVPGRFLAYLTAGWDDPHARPPGGEP